MKDNCEIRIAHPENPRSWLYTAYEYGHTNDYVQLEFTCPAYGGKHLEINLNECESQSMVRLTLPQAKKMREFLDHFIKTEESSIPMFN